MRCSLIVKEAPHILKDEEYHVQKQITLLTFLRAGIVIGKLFRDTHGTHNIRFHVPFARNSQDEYIRRCAIHIPRPNRNWQHPVAMVGVVCRDSLLNRFCTWCIVPSEPYPNDIHHVHCTFRDTRRRPSQRKGAVTHVPCNLCIVIHYWAGQVFH